MQDGGLQEGNRTVRGSVTCATRVVTGDGQNVRLFRVGFAFGEMLPNYLPKS